MSIKRFIDRIVNGLPGVAITPSSAKLEAAHTAKVIGLVEATGHWPRELQTALVSNLPGADKYRTIKDMSTDLDDRLRHASQIHGLVATAARGRDPEARAEIYRRGAIAVTHRAPVSALRSDILDQLADQDDSTAISTALEVPGRKPDANVQPGDPAAIYAARAQQARSRD